MTNRPPRSAEVVRETKETRIRLELDLDGQGRYESSLELGFLDHMLELMVRHSGIDLKIEAQGDLDVDDHHLTEDIGLALGQAIDRALGDRKGIDRYGFFVLPMDEVLATAAIDLGGRFSFRSQYRPRREKVGDFSCEMLNHFFSSLAQRGRLNLHLQLPDAGENEHHRIEGLFKAFARSLRQAVAIDPTQSERVPSTKGSLTV